MEKNISEILFDSKAKLFDSLCSTIQHTLESWLKDADYCGLILPGGETPRPLYEKLAACDLDWPKIHIGLSDERRVAAGCEHNNETRLRKELLDKIGHKALFQSLAVSFENETTDFDGLLRNMNQWASLDVFLVLGMGDDGHIASLFPDCDASMQSINQSVNKQKPAVKSSNPKIENHEKHAPGPLVLTCSPTAPKQRVSTSFHALRSYAKTVLLITGEEKMQRYLECKNSSPDSSAYSLPVAHLLRSGVGPERGTLDLYWAP